MEASEVKHNHPLDTNPEESGQQERKGEREQLVLTSRNESL